eukprot:2370683-Prorocentrum_lima.AAC.1
MAEQREVIEDGELSDVEEGPEEMGHAPPGSAVLSDGAEGALVLLDASVGPTLPEEGAAQAEAA